MLQLFLLRAAEPIESAGEEVVLQQVVPADHDVVQHAHVVEQRQVLEGPADPEWRARGRLQVRDVASLEDDPPFGRRVSAGDAVQHRRLAGAVRADDREQLAAVHAEADVVQRAHTAKAQGHVPDLEQRDLARHVSSPSEPVPY